MVGEGCTRNNVKRCTFKSRQICLDKRNSYVVKCSKVLFVIFILQHNRFTTLKLSVICQFCFWFYGLQRPLIVISGSMDLDQDSMGAFQELNQVNIISLIPPQLPFFLCLSVCLSVCLDRDKHGIGIACLHLWDVPNYVVYTVIRIFVLGSVRLSIGVSFINRRLSNKTFRQETTRILCCVQFYGIVCTLECRTWEVKWYIML